MRDELERMAGSPALAEELRRNLERLRDGVAGPELAEMARDVLSGQITLRDVARSAAYSGPILQAMERFRECEEQLSDEERADQTSKAAERFGEDRD
ncbi:hypothetical protein AB0F81_43645 [Actinoplanes sp. NPDC024001]|uniref:hypothetical protein n=1 Tax=Actinoplanes sp. NPDC024001 TaxID=3154598 RepID=UPI003409F073